MPLFPRYNWIPKTVGSLLSFSLSLASFLSLFQSPRSRIHLLFLVWWTRMSPLKYSGLVFLFSCLILWFYSLLDTDGLNQNPCSTKRDRGALIHLIHRWRTTILRAVMGNDTAASSEIKCREILLPAIDISTLLYWNSPVNSPAPVFIICGFVYIHLRLVQKRTKFRSRSESSLNRSVENFGRITEFRKNFSRVQHRTSLIIMPQ